MAVYKGSTKIGQIYKGSTKIGRIYKGSVLVYKGGDTIDVYSVQDRAILQTFYSVTSYDVSAKNVIINGDLYRVDSGSLILENSGGWTFLSKHISNSSKFYGIKNGDVYIISETGTVESKITTEGNWVKTGTYVTYTSDSSNVNNAYSLFLNSRNELYIGTQNGPSNIVSSDADDVGGYVGVHKSNSGTITNYNRLGWFREKSTGKIRFVKEAGSSYVYDSTNTIYNAKSLHYAANGFFLGSNNVLYNAETSTVTNNNIRFTSISNINTLFNNIKTCTKGADVTGHTLLLTTSNQLNIYEYSSGTTTNILNNCSGVSGFLNKNSSNVNVVTAVAISNGKLQELKYDGSNFVYNPSPINYDYDSIYYSTNARTSPILLIRTY